MVFYYLVSWFPSPIAESCHRSEWSRSKPCQTLDWTQSRERCYWSSPGERPSGFGTREICFDSLKAWARSGKHRSRRQRGGRWYCAVSVGWQFPQIFRPARIVSCPRVLHLAEPIRWRIPTTSVLCSRRRVRLIRSKFKHFYSYLIHFKIFKNKAW